MTCYICELQKHACDYYYIIYELAKKLKIYLYILSESVLT
jgi:hypothetical protein